MKAKIYYGSFESVRDQINRDHPSLRVDCHFNADGSPDPNYSMVLARIGAHTSKRIGQALVDKTASLLGIKNNGVKELRLGQRGYITLKYMNCPAILWEPCFVSNPAGADVVKHKRYLLHDAFLETIRHAVPGAGLIALVAGHDHKRRGDSGASVYGGGTEATYTHELVEELQLLINGASSKPIQ